jgi:hypothetical protein
MAWRCSGVTNEALIDNMVEAGLIADDRISEAMKAVRPLIITAASIQR